MSEDWTAVAAEVAEGLAEAGTTAYIVVPGERTGGSDLDPDFAEPTVHACSVVYDEWTVTELNNSLIQSRNKKVLVEAVSLGFKPTPEHQFSESGVIEGRRVPDAEVILSVFPLAPAGDGQAVMWTLQVRR